MKYLFYKIWRNKILTKLFGKGRLFRLLFNLSPMYKNTGGKLIKVVDLLGREIDQENKDTLLLYIYNDGSVQKKYVIE